MTTSSTQSVDPRAKRWGIAIKYAVLLGIGFIVSPYIWAAIGGLVGMIAAAAVMGTTWMLLPVVEDKARNLRLRFITAEAAKNPVETLRNGLLDKTVALDARKTAIGKLKGQIRTFADKVDGIKDKYGAQDSGYIKLAADLVDLRRIAVQREQKWQEARAQLDRYSDSIDRAQMIWDAGNAAAAARESSGLTDADFYARLKSETAFDSIEQNYNTALADLDTSMLDTPVVATVVNAPQAALPAPASDDTVIDVPVVHVSSKSRASR